MKLPTLSLALGLTFSFQTLQLVAGAPNPAPSDDAALESLEGLNLPASMPVIRIDLDDGELQNLTETSLVARDNIAERGIHYQATAQAWLATAGCGSPPAVTWFPVHYSSPSNPRDYTCYEVWQGTSRKSMRSLLLTGPWGSDCRLVGYSQPGCQASTPSGLRLAIANNCLVPPPVFLFYWSFAVACGFP